MQNIVFICTGNICRSPMAEGYFRYRVKEIGRSNYVVSSMGTHGLNDSPATENAQATCLENGFDISSHKGRSLIGEELQKADLILCMEPMHIKFIQTFFPWNRERIFLLGAWPEKANKKSIIHDPMGGSMDEYRGTFKIISRHIERILPLL